MGLRDRDTGALPLGVGRHLDGCYKLQWRKSGVGGQSQAAPFPCGFRRDLIPARICILFSRSDCRDVQTAASLNPGNYYAAALREEVDNVIEQFLLEDATISDAFV